MKSRIPLVLWLCLAIVTVSLVVSVVGIVKIQRSQDAAKLALCAIRENDAHAVARRTYLLAHPALEQVLGFTHKEDIRALGELQVQLGAFEAVGCP